MSTVSGESPQNSFRSSSIPEEDSEDLDDIPLFLPSTTAAARRPPPFSLQASSQPSTSQDEEGSPPPAARGAKPLLPNLALGGIKVTTPVRGSCMLQLQHHAEAQCPQAHNQACPPAHPPFPPSPGHGRAPSLLPRWALRAYAASEAQPGAANCPITILSASRRGVR